MSRMPWPAIILVATLTLIAAVAPLLGLPDPTVMNVLARLSPPSAEHLLGQDEFGRDVLSRLIWGARVSLMVAFASALVSSVIGTALGIIGGYMRGISELLAIRSMDIILCFPPLLLALLVVALIGPGIGTLIPILAILYLPGFTRIAYAGVLSARNLDYVEAMRVLGAPAGSIMLRTILPNIIGPIVVQFSLVTASAITLESGLSFLGLGVVPPEPSWGMMIDAARATMDDAPWLLLWPCAALTATILAMNLLCDGLRDVLDPLPKHRRGGRGIFDTLAPGLLPPPRPVLDIENLSIGGGRAAGVAFQPVRDVSLQIGPGETLAVVGESGSGKSLTSLAVMGLLPPQLFSSGGAVRLAGQELLRLDEHELRKRRGANMAMVFQDSGGSLNPTRKIGEQIAEAARVHTKMSASSARRRSIELLREVGITDPERRAKAYPHELSGGMRQRVMIAMAIANAPQLLIADEPTTALDVTIQAQILDLLADLQARHGMALLFITHSLPVVAEFAERVAVMYAGEVVEEGPTAEVFGRPLHPYTAALLASSPREDTTELPKGIGGIVPRPDAMPSGCTFAPRCAHRLPSCEIARPALKQLTEVRRSRCLRWSEL